MAGPLLTLTRTPSPYPHPTRLQPLLEAAGVKAADWNGYGGDPFEFLPKWMSQNPLRSK